MNLFVGDFRSRKILREEEASSPEEGALRQNEQRFSAQVL
uniref:Uncharacterized protein n=1 Tax=Anguilla anguilla TaxID=7936 RepID=A0A0E9UTZ7_ANGAN